MVLGEDGKCFFVAVAGYQETRRLGDEPVVDLLAGESEGIDQNTIPDEDELKCRRQDLEERWEAPRPMIWSFKGAQGDAGCEYGSDVPRLIE